MRKGSHQHVSDSSQLAAPRYEALALPAVVGRAGRNHGYDLQPRAAPRWLAPRWLALRAMERWPGPGEEPGTGGGGSLPDVPDSGHPDALARSRGWESGREGTSQAVRGRATPRPRAGAVGWLLPGWLAFILLRLRAQECS